MVRRYLITRLSCLHGVEIVGETGDPLEAISGIRQRGPDVVIVKIRARRRAGVDILRNIKKVKPSPTVVLLTHKLHQASADGLTEREADLSFDIFTELDKMVEALTKIPQGVPVGTALPVGA